MIMTAYDFDDDNPWHVNANLIFGFICQHCEESLHFDDVPECDPEDEFEAACVIVSNEAQKRGWKIIEEFSFSCPACSKGT